MGGIFGLVNRDGGPVAAPTPHVFQTGMAGDGVPFETQVMGCALLGGASVSAELEADEEQGLGGGVVCVAAGRVDNREELRLQLSTTAARSRTTDADLVRHAYVAWGEDCVGRIYGDWSFAAWHPDERRLFLARDHFGYTSLYYYADDRVFAFASERKALLALNLAPVEMDEFYLAQVIVGWTAYQGKRTIHKPIRRLPPAHVLTVTPEWLQERQYWRVEDTPVLRLPHREDYVHAFREVFDEAVRVRLLNNGAGQEAQNSIAATLSGGLDSGSVTVTAARFLRQEGKRITAFTAVPLSNTGAYVNGNGNEFALARETAKFAGNVDHFPITSAAVTPIHAIRLMLEISSEPSYAASNTYWIHDLCQTAVIRGHRILLTGQAGNASISWRGDVFSQPLSFQVRKNGYRAVAKERLRRIIPLDVVRIWRYLHTGPGWYHRTSVIRTDFAKRLHLLEQWVRDASEFPRTPVDIRCSFLLPGRSTVGAVQAEAGTAHGLEIRDPTADARVLSFTFSVPDDVFMDPKTGWGRWLIREAMKDRLPEAVRLNGIAGVQAADIVQRLRASAGEVNETLDELARGPAAEYLDVPYMGEVWKVIHTGVPREAFRRAALFMRGIMAGLWVNGFYRAF